jgi:hypothetical protein
MNEALNYAICDIRDNHEAYTHHFIRRWETHDCAGPCQRAEILAIPEGR